MRGRKCQTMLHFFSLPDSNTYDAKCCCSCKELTHSTLYFSPLPHSPPSLAVIDLLIYDKNIINVACIYRVGIINHSELLLLLISTTTMRIFSFSLFYIVFFLIIICPPRTAPWLFFVCQKHINEMSVISSTQRSLIHRCTRKCFQYQAVGEVKTIKKKRVSVLCEVKHFLGMSGKKGRVFGFVAVNSQKSLTNVALKHQHKISLFLSALLFNFMFFKLEKCCVAVSPLCCMYICSLNWR